MGRSIHLICKDCREYIWLGQKSTGQEPVVYNQWAKQGRFCFQHMGHTMTLGDSNWPDLPEYAEFEPDKEEDLGVAPDERLDGDRRD